MSAEYNLFETLHIDAVPDPALLASALRRLMARHDALCLRIIERDGAADQEVCGDLEPPVEWFDASDVSPLEAERRAKQIGDASARRAFALDTAPLFHITAVRLPQGRCVLILVSHHIIMDYWSAALLLEELCLLLAGASLTHADTPSYLDYVDWERSATDPTRVAVELDYWRQKLGGDLPVLDLPTDRPRPVVSSREGRAIPLNLSAEATRRIREFATHERTTLFTVLLAVYKVLLLRLSGQTDVIVGTSLAGRDHPLSEKLVGCFVKTSALRTELGGDLSFREALRRVHLTTLEAQDHQAVPWEQIVAALKVPRELNHHPVFQTFFGLQSAPALSFADARIGAMLLECDSAKWDLTISITDAGAELHGFIEYATDLLGAVTVARFAGMYVALAEALVADPDRQIHMVPLISLKERNRILHELNPYEVPRHPYRTMAEPFEMQVARTPDAVALVGNEGSLTYAELNIMANRLAHFLRDAGAGRGARIALCTERSFGTIISIYAIAKSGAAYVPLDPELPDARIAFMLEDTRPLLILVDNACRARIPAGRWRVVSIDDAELWDGLPDVDLACEGPPHHPVHLLYTSGSTGRPKAVSYPADGAIADILWLQRTYSFAPGDTALFKTSYGFDVSIWEIFWPLYFGARLAICPSGDQRDPLRLIELIDQYGVTTMFIIPTLMQVFLEQMPAGSSRSLRWVFCGGETVTPHIRDRFHAQLSGRLVNCYGPTEAGCVTDMVIEPAFGAPTVPLGRPAANFRLYVLDEAFDVMPIGVPGEAYLGGGVGLAHGYFERPALTAERFLPDPYGPPGARMYRTGDICRYREDGVLEHLGRYGRQLKVRGMRIEPGEVESVFREHTTVEECVVLASDESPPRLLAFVVPAPDQSFSPPRLMQHARRLLPRYMVPAAVVEIDRIPANHNGKTDREQLLNAWRCAGTADDYEIVAPAGEQEERLAAVFARILDVPQVSVTANFFEIGGHSLLIFKLIEACALEFQVRPSVAEVFASPTVRELAQRLIAVERPGTDDLVPLDVKPGKPIIVFIHAASGSALPFLEVARCLGDFSLYGIQSPALRDSQPRYSIDDLAARYVNAVDAVRGLSPVSLVGWSMGGCVALEMARRWRAVGIDPAALVILDTWAPPPMLSTPELQVKARAAILNMDVLALEGFTHEQLSTTPDAVAQITHIIDCNRQAFVEYDPAWLDAEVDLLCASEPYPDPVAWLPDDYTLPDRGWSRRIRVVKPHTIAGNHFTLLAAAHAAALAAQLRDIVEARTDFVEM
ncbi:non-ribosomal peptide synthetase (plasmid) [Rhizobium leguminosarum]